MEKKLIIFTEEEGIKRVFKFNKSKRLSGFFEPINNYDIIFYNHEILSPADSISNGSIFIINDEIKESKFIEFIAGIMPKNLFILKHSCPTFNFISNPNFRFIPSNIVEGKNEPSGKYYPEVLKTIEKNEGNVFEDVFNILFMPKKEIVIEFLNHCIDGLPELPQELSNENSIVIQYVNWKSKKDSKELETLRVMLLKWADVKD